MPGFLSIKLRTCCRTRRPVAAWKSKKRIIKTEEQEGDKTIVREREQFFHELALVFANGETALLE
jgi:hypothetical protein